MTAFVQPESAGARAIGGDERADYGKVLSAMVLLQQAGVAKVGLMSQPQQPQRRPAITRWRLSATRPARSLYALIVHVLCIGALFAGLLWTQWKCIRSTERAR